MGWRRSRSRLLDRRRDIRADRGRQDRGRDRAGGAAAGAGRGPGGDLLRRAAGLRRAGDADRGGDAPRSGRGSSTGCWASCRSRSRFSVGDYMRLAHAEIDAALEAGRRPIVVGGTGLYLRAAMARAVAGEGAAGDGGLRAVVAGDPAPDDDLRARHGPRPALRADRRADRRRSSPRAPRRRCGAPKRWARPARRARRSASTSCSPATSRRMKKRSRNYARRQLTWMRKIPNLRWIDRTGRERRRRRRGDRRNPR